MIAVMVVRCDDVDVRNDILLRVVVVVTRKKDLCTSVCAHNCVLMKTANQIGNNMCALNTQSCTAYFLSFK